MEKDHGRRRLMNMEKDNRKEEWKKNRKITIIEEQEKNETSEWRINKQEYQKNRRKYQMKKKRIEDKQQ